LEAIAELVRTGQGKWDEEGETLKKQHEKLLADSWWPQELSKLMVAIVERKHQIWTHFVEVTGGTPEVDRESWESILSFAVGSSWHWDMAWNSWRLAEQCNGGKVNFPYFLQRFGAVLSKTEYMSFKFSAISRVFDKMLNCHASLAETLKMFDRDGNGKVDMKEMRKALSSFDVGLSSEELESLVHIFFKGVEQVNGVPKIDVKAFLGRFAMVYRHADDAISEAARSQEERCLHEAMSRIGQVVATTPLDVLENCCACTGSKSTTSFESAKGRKKGKKQTAYKSKHILSNMLLLKIERLFELLDENNNGFLETEEFVKGMRMIPGILDITLSNQQRLDVVLLRTLAKSLQKHDQISVLEFMQAFCYEDHNGIADTLAEHMVSVLFRYRHTIRAGCRFFDTEQTLRVAQDDFLQVLQALNGEMDQSSLRFTQFQMEDLCEAVQVENDGKAEVAYEEFLSTFEIVDAENAAATVRMASRAPSSPKASPRKFDPSKF
jgi:Ca2+-binding EF-hand superfamily protein